MHKRRRLLSGHIVRRGAGKHARRLWSLR
jgi:hypothetical protein